ncbi:hypothetical protein BROUX41_006321 [Berkeleyomyces rouxiae]
MSVSRSGDAYTDEQTLMDVSLLSDEATLVASPAYRPVNQPPPKRLEDDLACMICDVCPIEKAHLATHLGSKDHHNAYAQLRAASETSPMCKQKLDNFISWCNIHNIPLPNFVLDMSKQQNVRGRRDGYLSSAHYVNEQARRFTSADPYRGMYYDTLPPMSEVFIPHRVPPTYLQGTAYLAQSYFDNTQPQPMMRFAENEADAEGEDDEDRLSESGIEYRPYGRQRVSSQSSTKKFNTHGRYSATIIKIKRGFNTFAGRKDREPPQLKGLCLPGIGIWDSATPSQRRYRNQRKGIDAIKRIEKMANMVGTIEEVWNLCMVKERERHIYDIPSAPNSPTLGPTNREPRCEIDPSHFTFTSMGRSDSHTSFRGTGSQLNLDGNTIYDNKRFEGSAQVKYSQKMTDIMSNQASTTTFNPPTTLFTSNRNEDVEQQCTSLSSGFFAFLTFSSRCRPEHDEQVSKISMRASLDGTLAKDLQYFNLIG